MQGGRGTWRSTASLAHAGRADDEDGTSLSASPHCCGWGGAVVRENPDPRFRENLARLAEVEAHSEVLDSRLELNCHLYGVDPVSRRAALLAGYTIRFATKRGRHSVVTHVIKPGDFD
jgi:hypothetical protein